MESIQSKIIKVLLRLVRYKRPMELSGDELRHHIVRTRGKESHEVPKKIREKYQVSQREINGSCCYVIKPVNTVGSNHILFLHGGGCVYEITDLHWTFLSKLADELKCVLTIPIYPLAPEHLCDEAYDMLISLYGQMVSEVKPEDITIMGDSAGGAMSLALAQLLNEKKLPQPGNIILISPTLDLTCTNPEISVLAKTDPLLATPALLEFGRWFGGAKGLEHPLVSPIFGSLEGLGKISLFIGTNDLLYADARRLKKMADEKGVEINFFAYPGMIHDWPLLPLPEAKRVREQIAEIIR